MKSVLFFSGSEEVEKNTISQPHFLDSCSLCQKPLTLNHDIFMYRGNTPFCSQECRQEQIEMDDAKERRWKRSSNRKPSSSSATKASADSRKESSAVAVA